MRGVESSNYLTTVDKLNPYTIYTFRIRCSTDPFGNGANGAMKQCLTTEASKLTE